MRDRDARLTVTGRRAKVCAGRQGRLHKLVVQEKELSGRSLMGLILGSAALADPSAINGSSCIALSAAAALRTGRPAMRSSCAISKRSKATCPPRTYRPVRYGMDNNASPRRQTPDRRILVRQISAPPRPSVTAAAVPPNAVRDRARRGMAEMTACRTGRPARRDGSGSAPWRELITAADLLLRDRGQVSAQRRSRRRPAL
jgi:hypothetical protein